MHLVCFGDVNVWHQKKVERQEQGQLALIKFLIVLHPLLKALFGLSLYTYTLKAMYYKAPC